MLYQVTFAPDGFRAYVEAYKGHCMLVAELPRTDETRAIQMERLTNFCRSWLSYRPGGEDYYRNSLVPATSYDPNRIFSGSVPDRRMGIAVQEADLHRALMSLPKLQRDCAVLARSDKKDRGWTRRWSQMLWTWNKQEWLEYQDQILDPEDKRVHSLRVEKVIRTLLNEAAEGMAEFLGPEWR